MSTVKRVFSNFSFYDHTAIEKKLEQMAAKGWMIRKAGSLFWTYEKIQPQKLRFAVTYFPSASEFDPYPSDKQLEKESLCAQDGWRLVLRWDAMQIFCTDREDAVPIETDPIPQVENIHRTMKKKLLTGQLFALVVILWYLYLQISQLRQDPVDYLSSTGHLFTAPVWLLLLLVILLEIGTYFRWRRKAEQAAEEGIFLPVRANPWLIWGPIALAAVFLLLSFLDSDTPLPLLACIALLMGVISFSANRLMGWMKKKGIPRTVNLAVSCICILVLFLAGTGGIVAAAVNGWLPISHDSRPTGTYEWNGQSFDIYSDPLPLSVEDLTDLEARWSKQAHQQGSPLLFYGEYRQSPLYTEAVGPYDLEYEIIDVKIPALYPLIQESLIDARQDEVHDDIIFTDHYEPIDPGPWNAQAVYQLHWSDSVLDEYLVCWETRLVEITFYWTPTQEQIKTAAAILQP